MAEAFVGLDVGTSKLSGVALDREGRLMASAALPNDAGVDWPAAGPGRTVAGPRLRDRLRVLAELEREVARRAPSG